MPLLPPPRPLCIFDELFETGVFFREEALEDGAEAVAVVLALRLPAFGGGVGDGVLEAALEVKKFVEQSFAI